MENTGIIYTDGSKKKNTGQSTGAAFIFEEEEQGFYLSINRRSTIFIAEVVAITKGIQKYEEKDTKKDNILILTDSMSAIKNIENNEITTYKNTYIMEARKRIYEIKKRKNRKVILAWIPAHIGITGNEIVDHSAK